MKLLLESKDSGIDPDDGLDETYKEIKSQFRRFVEEEITPNAHEWHLNDEYIPIEIIEKMSNTKKISTYAALLLFFSLQKI